VVFEEPDEKILRLICPKQSNEQRYANSKAEQSFMESREKTYIGILRKAFQEKSTGYSPDGSKAKREEG
jgi:hypothetical protein